MQRRRLFLASLILLPGGFLVCQSGAFQTPKSIPRSSRTAQGVLDSGSLVLELDRAIVVLQRGLDENWESRDRYLVAFEETPSTDLAGQPVADAKRCVADALALDFRVHQMMDEGPPIGVEAQRTISQFTKWREQAEQRKAATAGTANPEGPNSDHEVPACAGPARKKVQISAGVASGMLKTKIDPVYPIDALKDQVSGTVILQATISTRGRVESLHAISGPASLWLAAINAVKQWTYRPYLLNGAPIEVETTINVVFAPGH